MPRTSKMGWTYPTEGQPTWYQVFVSLMNAMDADVYSSIEDANLVLNGGGMITLDTGTDTLTWTEDIELLSLITGGVITIEAGSLSGFTAGKIAYVEVARPVVGSRVLTLATADTLSGNRNYVFIAMRRGDEIFVRNAANRSNIVSIDYWGASKYTTGEIAASGGVENGQIAVGVEKGSIWKLKVTATGNTVDSTIQFFSDAARTDEIYVAANKDCFTSPFEDGSSWFVGVLTSGQLYYTVTNDGANPSYYDIELVGTGDAG